MPQTNPFNGWQSPTITKSFVIGATQPDMWLHTPRAGRRTFVHRTFVHWTFFKGKFVLEIFIQKALPHNQAYTPRARRKNIFLRDICPRDIFLRDICPRDICSREIYSRGTTTLPFTHTQRKLHLSGHLAKVNKSNKHFSKKTFIQGTFV